MKTKVIQNDPDGGSISGPPPPAAVAGRPRRRGGVVAGVLTAVLGAGALAVGGVLIGVTPPSATPTGSTTARAPPSAPPRAPWSRTTRTSAPTGPPGYHRLGDVRVAATGARDGPVFVGIGAREDVDAYLAGVAHEEAELDGSAGRARCRPGRARRRRPRAAPSGPARRRAPAPGPWCGPSRRATGPRS